MRRLILAVLLLVPCATFAASCKYEAPRSLRLDLAGVRGVQIDVNNQSLHLTGSTSASGLVLDGRACASEQAALADLTVTQRREGDQLVLELAAGGNYRMSSLFGSSYDSLKVNVQLPASLPVTLRVGSGDATVSGVRQLQGQVGSGDLHVSRVAEKFAASVGSGDIDASDIGSLQLGSVGSGDFKAHGITGDASIGSIGSGDVTLRQVGGSVHADTLGSGDLSVSDVGGDFSLRAKGSGDVSHSAVKGKLSVPRGND